MNRRARAELAIIHKRSAQLASTRPGYNRLPLHVNEAMRFRRGSIGALMLITNIILLGIFAYGAMA